MHKPRLIIVIFIAVIGMLIAITYGAFQHNDKGAGVSPNPRTDGIKSKAATNEDTASEAKIMADSSAFASSFSRDPASDAPPWIGRPFDLIYDALWTTSQESLAGLNDEDELFVTGGGAFRFVMDSDWESFASGKVVKVTVDAKSLSGSNIEYEVAYTTNEVGRSDWQKTVASDKYSTFSFEYKIGQMRKGNKDYVIIRPVSDSNQEGILIRSAILEIVP